MEDIKQKQQAINENSKETKPFVKKTDRPGGPRKPGMRPRKEFSTDLVFEIIKIKKVTKVVKGGRRYRFSVIVVGGDKKGRVGYGTGKAFEVPDAIKKAKKEVLKNMIRVPLTKETQTIAHEIIGHKGASQVLLKPATEGTGIVAGGSIRIFLELGGVRNIYSKSFGARSELNMILATIDGIKNLRTKQQISKSRDKKVAEIMFN
ncbi:MAG: 30S ribosomal protein S5 [Mycoplasma sp.]